MRALVTGGVARGDDVVIVDDFSSGKRDFVTPSG
jgi:hypothetical protein